MLSWAGFPLPESYYHNLPDSRHITVYRDWLNRCGDHHREPLLSLKCFYR